MAVSACFNPRESVIYVAKPSLLLFVQSLKHPGIALLLCFFLQLSLTAFGDRLERLVILCCLLNERSALFL
jgi:hypothetical protein